MVLDRIEEQYKQMFPAEKKVADYIRENAGKVVDMNIAELAEHSNTSEATVIRICRRLGYKGFYQLKISLAKEGTQRQLIGYHGEQDDPETVNYILQETAKNIVDLSQYLNMGSIVACAKLIREANILHVVATGTTAPVAQDFAFRLSRLGIRTNCSFVPEYCLGNINLGDSSDVVVAISHSGSSISILQAVELAQKKQMKVIAITDVMQSPVAKFSAVTLATPVRNNLYQGFGAASNVHTLVILDVLLYFIGNLDRTTKEIDDLELLLAEYKL
jgi:DNA-binding MurR/RpiR family transcriptional regulator